MSLPIQAIRPPAGIQPSSVSIGAKAGGAPGAFQSVLSEAIQSVQQAQNNAQSSTERFLSGENEEIHQVALDAQRAQLSFDMFMAVRNKVVSAYQEVMRMQM